MFMDDGPVPVLWNSNWTVTGDDAAGAYVAPTAGVIGVAVIGYVVACADAAPASSAATAPTVARAVRRVWGERERVLISLSPSATSRRAVILQREDL
jgi:hypothetical protein